MGGAGCGSDVGRRGRIHRRLSAAWRAFPLTDLGVLVLAAGLLGFFGYGQPRSDYVIQLVSAVAIGLVALALLVVLIGAWRVHARSRRPLEGPIEPLRLEATRSFARADIWPRVRWLPLLELDVEVSHPAGLRLREEGGRERVEADHRAGDAGWVRRFRVEDAFGLAEVCFERPEARPVEVSPWLGALDRAPALAALAPGAQRPHPHGAARGDRVELRPYVRGDPLRLVLWKVYARTGELIVRTEERALDEDVEVIAHLVTGDGDEASAAAAHVALARGLLGPRWCFGTSGLTAPTRDPATAIRAIARSRGAPAEGLAATLAAGDAEARLLLFVPCRAGAWLVPTLELTRARGPRATVVLAHDGAPPAASGPRWRIRRASVAPGAAAASPESIAEVQSAFARIGAEVLVIERPTGRVSGGAARRVAA